MTSAFKMFAASLILAMAVLSLPNLSARAADAPPAVLKVVPDDVLAVIVINRLDKADAAIGKLMQTMRVPATSVVDMIKREIGGGETLDDKGSWAVAVFAGDTPQSAPSAVMFVPTTDYKKFASSLKAKDPTADVTAIELSVGRSSFVGHKENFVLIPEPSVKEPEALLKKIIASSSSVDTVTASLNDWTSSHEFAAIATPAGVKKGTAAARESLKMVKGLMAGAGGDQAMAASVFEMYDSMLASVEKNVSVAAGGGHLDDTGALHVDGRVVYTHEASSSVSRETGGKVGEGLAALPGGPFIVAMEGAFPESLMKSMLPMSLEMLKSAAKSGGKDLTPEQIKKLTDAAAGAWTGVRSMAMVMGQPKVGESLYAGTVLVMKVDDSQKFLANYQRSLEGFAEISKTVDNPLFPSTTVEKTTIDGAAGLLITVDLSAIVAKSGQNPGSQEVMKMFVGPSGKMKAYLWPTDANTVALAYITPDNIKLAIDAAKNPTKSLASDVDISQTVSVMPRGAQWTGYISPRGMFDFVIAIMAKAGPNGGMQPPRFPQTPPVGFAVEATTSRLDLSIVVPSSTLKGFGEYVQSMTNRMLQPQPVQPQPQIQ